jgi:hypothetical protein
MRHPPKLSSISFSVAWPSSWEPTFHSLHPELLGRLSKGPALALAGTEEPEEVTHSGACCRSLPEQTIRAAVDRAPKTPASPFSLILASYCGLVLAIIETSFERLL